MTPSTNDNWVRRFIVSDPKKHRNGFTVYKVTSILFPKGSPEAATKVIVWKRYNDFKKLHYELQQKHKKLYLQGKFPPFAEAKFFRRFEEEVIEERRKCATVLLEFIGAHPPLFTSNIFIKFFEVGYPQDDCDTQSCSVDKDNNTTLETSVVNQQETISPVGCSDGSHLKKGEENGPLLKLGGTWQYPQVSDSISLSSHSSEEHTSFTDTDSAQSSGLQTAESPDSPVELPPKNQEEGWTPQSEVDSSRNAESSNPLLESSSLLNDRDYVAQAHHHVSLALRHKAAGTYDAAFSLMKIGISCLLTGVQDETDTERRRSVKKKACEYLLVAEKLYNEHLMPRVPINSEPYTSDKSIASPLPGLQAFKVLGVIDKVMLAMSTEEDQCYIVKVLHKSPCPVNKNQVPILPHNVPYMVKLHFYFETESTVFLFLQHASGGRLWDHIRCYLQSQPTTPVHLFSHGNVYLGRKLIQESPGDSDKVQAHEMHDSYAALIQNYRESKRKTESNADEELSTVQPIDEKEKVDLDVDHVIMRRSSNVSDASDTKSFTHHLDISNSVSELDSKGLGDLETNELMRNAKLLLSSVNETLLKSGLDDQETPVESPNIKQSLIEESNSSKVKPHLKCLPMRQRSSGPRPSLERRRSSDDLFDWRPHSACGSSSGRHWERPIPRIPEVHVRQWAEQLVLCLAALHESGLVYRDLHPDNVLLAEDGHLLLSFTCSWPAVDPLVNKEAVQKLYAAPEVTSIFEPSSAVDWWSLGALLFELITGKPLHISQPGGVYSHSILNFPDFVSTEAQSLLTELLRYYPQERLGAGVGGVDEIKSHPFFTGTDWSAVRMAGHQT